MISEHGQFNPRILGLRDYKPFVNYKTNLICMERLRKSLAVIKLFHSYFLQLTPNELQDDVVKDICTRMEKDQLVIYSWEESRFEVLDKKKELNMRLVCLGNKCAINSDILF